MEQESRPTQMYSWHDKASFWQYGPRKDYSPFWADPDFPHSTGRQNVIELESIRRRRPRDWEFAIHIRFANLGDAIDRNVKVTLLA